VKIKFAKAYKKKATPKLFISPTLEEEIEIVEETFPVFLQTRRDRKV